MKLTLGSALLACAVALPAHADDCKHTAHRTVNSAGPGIERVVIEAKAGDLVVRGAESRDVSVEGRACASTAELLEASQLEIRREGTTVYVRTVLPDIQDSFFGMGRYAYMDVRVGVPKNATLKIDDSSGDMEVAEVQAATITDSSGDVDVDGVQGDVLVEVDSSGDLDIRHVSGGVHVRNDSSGDIEIHDVKRDVLIDEDSSGGIRVQDVGGNFTVGSDGSGGIHFERVTGQVQLPD